MEALWNRFTSWFIFHANLLKDPESMVGAFIMTFWVVMAGATGGWVAILVLLLIAGVLHAAAVETGNHVVLFLATTGLLILIVIASQATFGGLSPVLLAVGGATALGHNELVRINYTRRRSAVIHAEVYHASGLAVGAASLIGIVAVIISQVFAIGNGRNWLWVPSAAIALLAVGFALAIVPAMRATEASKERWSPGDRIPPQPLGKDELEQF